MKVLDFDSSEFLSRDEFEANSKGIVKRRAKRVPTGWWNDDDAPRRFRKRKPRKMSRGRKSWEDWSNDE